MKKINLILLLLSQLLFGQTNNYLTILDSTQIDGYQLFDFYPNPFSPVTFIEFQIPDTSEVLLSISDTSYQRIDTLYCGSLPVGKYQYDFIEIINKYRSVEKVLLGNINFEATNKKKYFLKKENYYKSSKGIFWLY